MKVKSNLLLAVLAAIVAACATAPAPPPLVEPEGDARFLIDPRTGVKTVVEPWLMVSEVQFLSAVPEPSTWIMMILGFGALAFVSFRKSQKALNLAPI